MREWSIVSNIDDKSIQNQKLFTGFNNLNIIGYIIDKSSSVGVKAQTLGGSELRENKKI